MTSDPSKLVVDVIVGLIQYVIEGLQC